ncbi:hypothetical protein PR202_ga13180 [Eleusine coracana subsp. coracana]|uniref:Uncharacterized protein n=1 Tax=Eleusine coracana subsp. coracana TaxID=191504 RepID=A0AAV5CE90_ELECO|nr:hypothetical protein PR202_ga13180 [Eleusine coracana subsp. coracana]
MDDNLATLRAYRRARGLCEKCAERWVRGHRCSATVQLHVLEEMWELCCVGEDGHTDDKSTKSQDEMSCCLISVAAMSGSQAPGTIKLQGVIQDQKVCMLIDLGSSYSFVSRSLAEKILGAACMSSTVRVQVANGDVLSCTHQFTKLPWAVNGYIFQSDFKVLNLSAYDVILGMDWLETHSP